jgi:hypothetical protein
MRADRQIARDPEQAGPIDPLVNDIGQRHTAHWPKPSQGIADWQQGIGMDVRRQAKCRFGLFLELQVQRRQRRATPSALAASSIF